MRPTARQRARRFRAAVEPLVSFLLPSSCFCCHTPLGWDQRLGACAACWCGFGVLSAPLCPTCGLPRPPDTDLLGPAGGRCAACVLAPPITDAVRAAVAYDATARAFVLRAKLGRRREVLGALAPMLARVIEATGLSTGCTLVIPAPSHLASTLRRGFSPALELARPVARRLGLPLAPRALRQRLRIHPPAKRLAARRRWARARAAIVAVRSLSGERILLVDDVMTTGATAAACAAALKSAGAREVRCAVWARTLPHGSA